MVPGSPAASRPAAHGIVADSDAPSPRFAVRVGVVHGNGMTLDLLHTCCANAWGCEVVAADHAPCDALASIERTRPDVVLVGHLPPLLDSLDLLPKLRRSSAATKTIVLAERLNDHFVYQLSRIDFNAVVEESTEGLDSVRVAIEQVRAGSRYLSPKFVQMASRLRADPDSFPKLLSDRQDEVLVCIAHAMNDAEIGRHLGMSARTAQRHRADIAHKLGVHGTSRLIRYGMEKGFYATPLPVTGPQATGK